MTNALEVRGLNKRYPKSDFALKDVNLIVPQGTIMGFVGENGAGKSTTMGCIMNTLIKDSGSVQVFGTEMTDDATALRDQIGVVYDTNPFPEYLTPKQVGKAMAPIYTNWDEPLYRSLLEKLKLPYNKSIKSFSRGMTMKFQIAVALAHHPKLLILDEPTSGLDPMVREDILELLLDYVQDETNSVLFSSHITTDLEKIADYITFIHDGEVIFSDTKDELLYHYGIVRARAAQVSQLDPADIIASKNRGHQVDVLLRHREAARRKYRDMVIDDASIEEIMLLIAKGQR